MPSCWHDSHPSTVDGKTSVRRLRTLAAKKGSSISQLVRDGVDNVLAQTEQKADGSRVQRAVAAAGRFHSGREDVAPAP